MAEYTKAQFRTEVRALLNEATASFWTDTNIDEWIDQGQRDIAEKALCIENTAEITTADGTREYSYTGLEIETCIYNNKGLLRVNPKQIGHIDKEHNDKTPKYYYVFNDKIGILPIPNAAYTVTYFAYIDSVDFADDSATSNLPIRYQDLIILYAYARGLYKDSQFAKAGQVYNQYINELQFLRGDRLLKERDSRKDFDVPEGRVIKAE